MGFLEKLKNTFFEEEYVEVEEKVKPRKEVIREDKRNHYDDIKPLVEEEKEIRNVRKDEIVHEGLPEKKYEEIKMREARRTKNEESSRERVESKNSFSYFDDTDFVDFAEEVKPTSVREERKTVVVEKTQEAPRIYDNPNYASKNTKISKTVTTSTTTKTTQTTAYTKQLATGFKPTPIISPIYGILDQNYTKDEVIEKKESRPSSYVSRKNVDLDSVREKAFGSLSSDLGLTGQAEEEVVDTEDTDFDIEDNLLYDMTDVTTTPTVDKVTLQDAEEYFQDLGLEYNIDYKDAKLERATGRRVAKTPKTLEIEEEEVEEVEIKPEKKNEEYSFSMEDNLFDLIDSMYEEKE